MEDRELKHRESLSLWLVYCYLYLWHSNMLFSGIAVAPFITHDLTQFFIFKSFVRKKYICPETDLCFVKAKWVLCLCILLTFWFRLRYQSISTDQSYFRCSHIKDFDVGILLWVINVSKRIYLSCKILLSHLVLHSMVWAVSGSICRVEMLNTTVVTDILGFFYCCCKS